MITDIISAVASILDKIIPDPKQREEAKLNLLKAENQQALEEAKAGMAAILAEAQSQDKWTSRARPSFLYVVYVMLLSAIPMGIVYAVSPATAGDITKGYQAWLAAIPEPIVRLFEMVMLGYICGRSWEKIKTKSK
ncbi:MAG: holin family protein [Alphaproteobacteria bacterium]